MVLFTMLNYYCIRPTDIISGLEMEIPHTIVPVTRRKSCERDWRHQSNYTE